MPRVSGVPQGMPGPVEARNRQSELLGALEHFEEKWNPVFRPEMRQWKDDGAVSMSGYVNRSSPKLWNSSFESLSPFGRFSATVC